jgi:hypothetical protein
VNDRPTAHQTGAILQFLFLYFVNNPIKTSLGACVIAYRSSTKHFWCRVCDQRRESGWEMNSTKTFLEKRAGKFRISDYILFLCLIEAVFQRASAFNTCERRQSSTKRHPTVGQILYTYRGSIGEEDTHAICRSRRLFCNHAMSVFLIPVASFVSSPSIANSASPVTPKETDSLGAMARRALRPKPPKILRRKLSMDFAVLLMRSSYNALDQLDCVAMVSVFAAVIPPLHIVVLLPSFLSHSLRGTTNTKYQNLRSKIRINFKEIFF